MSKVVEVQFIITSDNYKAQNLKSFLGSVQCKGAAVALCPSHLRTLPTSKQHFPGEPPATLKNPQNTIMLFLILLTVVLDQAYCVIVEIRRVGLGVGLVVEPVEVGVPVPDPPPPLPLQTGVAVHEHGAGPEVGFAARRPELGRAGLGRVPCRRTIAVDHTAMDGRAQTW